MLSYIFEAIYLDPGWLGYSPDGWNVGFESVFEHALASGTSNETVPVSLLLTIPIDIVFANLLHASGRSRP